MLQRSDNSMNVAWNYLGTLAPIFVMFVHALVYLWVRKRSRLRPAVADSGRLRFLPVFESRVLMALAVVTLAGATALSRALLQSPGQRWVTYLFVLLLVTVPLTYPPVLILDEDGISSRTWYGSETKIQWSEIVTLEFRLGKKHFVVGSNRGSIVHTPYIADQPLFMSEVRERTRLPMKVFWPGFWRTKSADLPYRIITSGPKTKR
jgi:hypothetical protein